MNLYTIVPLRASASETLTEKTIGRDLRLPYGERTCADEVDRLSIVSHDKYEAIVNLANDPNSLVRRVYYISSEETGTPDKQRVTVEMPTTYNDVTSDTGYMEQLALTFVRDRPLRNGSATNIGAGSAGCELVASYALYQSILCYDVCNRQKRKWVDKA